MFETGSSWAKSRSIGQFIENHIVYIRFKNIFTSKLIALRSRFQSFAILHQSYMFYQELIYLPNQMMDLVHIWHNR